MPEFAPIASLAEFSALDDADVVAGYHAGRAGAPEPLGSNFSRSYWHGWRNGAVDGGFRAKDCHQVAVAHAFVCAQAAGRRVNSPNDDAPCLPIH